MKVSLGLSACLRMPSSKIAPLSVPFEPSSLYLHSATVFLDQIRSAGLNGSAKLNKHGWVSSASPKVDEPLPWSVTMTSTCT